MGLSVKDRLNIYDLFARYCQYVDSGRAAEWVNLFAEDGCFEIVGQMTLRGAGQLGGMPAMLAERSGGKWRHQITDIMIDAGPSDDAAHVGASGLVTDWNDGGRVIMFANYQGALGRGDGRWRIARLTATMLTG
ncbi:MULTISPECIES: nuclear transport factor 2 family protein [Sphingobium]|uniref:nuclear transport factor 2 family protein n=1 Tax=Sphingobium TaxID=165695 RepID=UPI0007703985|nr:MULTISPECIES: nuclear transport factor 2 family protein [unclassified Sphingobium]AMK25756.1 hypothetical protein K426_24264 [Sphingobium sp. TKS]MEC6700835.1 nuclear transport factor 2 family protein [Sphingobium sp. SJ10-10]NML87773.1 nuclear transport factor 2 family protein [Sphingobium sp. TB-6]PNQ04375.1 hypothetical protein A8G00_01960 [Sphingobium sp. SA916]